MLTITRPEIFNIISLIVGLAGLAFAFWQYKKRKAERKEAYREIRHVFSQLWHIQWWVLNKVTPDGKSVKRTDAIKSEEMQSLVIAQLHQLAITLKSSALRYDKKELERIKPHPKDDPLFDPEYKPESSSGVHD